MLVQLNNMQQQQEQEEGITMKHTELHRLLLGVARSQQTAQEAEADAVQLISSMQAQELYTFMVQLVAGSGGVEGFIPDSPKRSKHSTYDQDLSTSCTNQGLDARQQQDNSTLTHAAPGATATTASSGRCFIAESLELNLGSSYDWIAKASLNDFSTAAAAARSSRTGLVSTSIMQQRMLSPVEEASMGAATYDPQEDLASSSSEQQAWHGTTMSDHQDPGAAAPPALAAAWTAHVQPSTADVADLSTKPDLGAIPSCCSSPRDLHHEQYDHGATTRAAAAAAVCRQSAAESARDWPRALPVHVDDDVETEAEDTASPATPARLDAPAAAAAMGAYSSGIPRTPAGCMAPPAAAAAVLQQGPARPCTADGDANHSSGGGGSTTNADTLGSKQRNGRLGGGGFGRALLAPVNALRRSLSGRNASRSNSSSNNGKAPKRPGSSALPAAPSPAPVRSLARGSAPVISVYGGSSSAGPRGLSAASPGVMHNGSRLASFTVTKEGGSPVKAAQAAVLAAGGHSRGTAAGARAGGGSSGTGSGSRGATGNTSYRPPSAPGAGRNTAPAPAQVAAGAAVVAGSSPAAELGRMAAAAAETPSRIGAGRVAASRPCATAGAASRAGAGAAQVASPPVSTSAGSRACSSMYGGTPGRQWQHHHHHHQHHPQHQLSRPCSQASDLASEASYGGHSEVRSQRSGYLGSTAGAGGGLAATASATSGGGAIPSFHTTRQMLAAGQQGMTTTTPLSRQRPAAARGAVAARAREAARAERTAAAAAAASPGVITGSSSSSGGGGKGQPGSSAFSSAGSTFSSRIPTLQAVGGGGSGRPGGVAGGHANGLRRSRSCGSLAELQQAVSHTRQMWQQREAAELGAAAKHRSASLQQQQQPARTLAHQVQQQAQARHNLRQIPSSSGAAAAAAVMVEPGLPELGVCQSPAKRGVVRTDTAAAAAVASSPSIVHQHQHIFMAVGDGGASTCSPAVPVVTPTTGGPHPLARKLLATAGCTAGPGLYSSTSSRQPQQQGMMQQQHVPGGVRLPCGGGGVVDIERSNPVESPPDSPALSGCSQVSRGTGGLHRWSAAGSSHTAPGSFSLHTSDDISRQLF